MRVFPRAARVSLLVGVTTALVASLTSSGAVAAPSSDPVSGAASAKAIEAKLTAARRSVDALYEQAAVASEQLNGATYRLGLARKQLTADKAQVARAKARAQAQKDAIATLTVQQLQGDTTLEHVNSLLGASDPIDLLDRATTYTSAQDALSARMEQYSAATVVYTGAVRKAKATQAAAQDDVAAQASAKAQILSTLASAKATEKKTAAQRTTLLKQLAKARKISLAKAKARQAAIDAKTDDDPPVPAKPASSGSSSSGSSSSGSSGSGSSGSGSGSGSSSGGSSAPSAPSSPGAPSSSAVEKAIAYAEAQIGKPYVWGAAGPGSFDCSGLTMMAYAAAGISIPHYGVAQYEESHPISVGSIRRGDLVYWSYGSVSSIYHVAIYLGGGMIIQAPRPGKDVEEVPLSEWIQPDMASRPSA